MTEGSFRIVKETKGTRTPIFYIEQYRGINPVVGCSNWSRNDLSGEEYGTSCDLDFLKKKLEFIKEGDPKPVIEVVYLDGKEWGSF